MAFFHISHRFNDKKKQAVASSSKQSEQNQQLQSATSTNVKSRPTKLVTFSEKEPIVIEADDFDRTPVNASCRPSNLAEMQEMVYELKFYIQHEMKVHRDSKDSAKHWYFTSPTPWAVKAYVKNRAKEENKKISSTSYCHKEVTYRSNKLGNQSVRFSAATF